MEYDFDGSKKFKKLVGDLKEKIERVWELDREYKRCAQDKDRQEIAWKAKAVISKMKKVARKRGLEKKLTDWVIGRDEYGFYPTSSTNLSRYWPNAFTASLHKE